MEEKKMHSSIFCGQVSHSRTTPKAHSFQYRLFMMYLDLGELDRVFENRWLWSTSRPAIARFKRENYFGNPDEPLDKSIRDLVKYETGARPDGPIRLLTHLSYFGYSFNPISIYYCFDREDSRVKSIVAEVSNTPWGERHCYVLSDDMNSGDTRARQFRTEKELHVSPFMDMNVTYDWLLTEPADNLVVRINNKVNTESFFNATLVLRRQEITGPALARVLVAYPLMTLKVIWGIHWQAFQLWLKGCPVQTHPAKQATIKASR
jgi:DUF1365 family protein